VVVKVLVGVDGLPKSAEVKKSSGFDRLDKAAIEYIMKCLRARQGQRRAFTPCPMTPRQLRLELIFLWSNFVWIPNSA
jgi:TonB family protein